MKLKKIAEALMETGECPRPNAYCPKCPAYTLFGCVDPTVDTEVQARIWVFRQRMGKSMDTVKNEVQ